MQACVRNPATAQCQPEPGFAPHRHRWSKRGFGDRLGLCCHPVLLGRRRERSLQPLAISLEKWLLAALTQGAGNSPGKAQGRDPGEAAGWERGGQPARLRSPYRCRHHVPHQHADKEGSDHGPYPVNPVIVPVVRYQSWPEGSGGIHAGSGHAASERGTNRLHQPCGTRHRDLSPSLLGQGDAQGWRQQRTPPGLLAGGLALFWVGGRLGPPRPPSRHCCSVPGDSLLLQRNDARTRAAAAQRPARPDSPRWLLASGHLPSLTSVCKIPGKTRCGVEARVPSLFWSLPGAGLLNRGSSVPHDGSGAGQERR